MKEILTQLRTSHFWLVMASFGLMILPSFPRSSVYGNAYNELARLSAVNATITPQNLIHTFDGMALPEQAKQDPAAIVASAPWHVAQVSCQRVTSGRPGFLPMKARPAIWMTMPREEAAYPVPFQLPPAFSIPPGERTLAQFMEIWAFLDNDDHAFAVTAVASADRQGDAAFEVPGVVPRIEHPDQHLDCFVGSLTSLRATLDRADPQRAWLTLRGSIETDLVSRNGGPGSSAGGSFESQPIPVSVRTLDFPLFASHLRAYFARDDLSMTDLAGQQFSDAFADLVHVARGLQSLTLHDLRAYVERMTEESGTDVEIFGATLPVDVLVEWGIPALVIMQLYFWLHLVRFAASDLPSRDVQSFSWIACYPQLLARAVTICSVVLAPIAAVTLLYFGTEHGARSMWLRGGLILAAVASTVLAASTVKALLRLSRVPADAGRVAK